VSGPLPWYVAPLAVPASWLYGLAVGVRNRRFERGDRVSSVSVPVVSVGNVTAGGAGKTPTVTWLAAWLRAAGHNPAIAMRGYKARPGAPGDEQQEHLDRLPDVHVVATPDRVGALRAFLPAHPDVDCVLLDDGFQHRHLHRDLDLVLIDATHDTMTDRLLPRGYLREPLSSLGRADAVFVTRATSVDGELAAKVQRYHGRPPVAWSRHVWTRLQVVHPDKQQAFVEVPWLRGKRVVTLLGVAHPGPIIGQLEEAGATVARDIPARDHERYERPKLLRARSLCEGADALFMTAKDWVKARHLIDLPSWPVPIVVPWLEIDVYEGADDLKTLVLDAVSPPEGGWGRVAGAKRSVPQGK
jgi:tetraacyldisaccharide 4'-kinase